jgi:hypothetical protein
MRLKIIVPALASVVLVGFLLSLRLHRSESCEAVEVSLSEPYLRALASLGRKSSFESIVAAGGGSLVERSWDEFKFDLGRVPRLSTWEVRGHGKFKVRSQARDFSGEMELMQDVEADKHGIEVSSRLARPCGFVKAYETKTSIRNETPVAFRVENRIVYERLIPFWMADDVDNLVRDHNKKKVEAVAEVIRSIVEGDAPSRYPANTAHQYFLPLLSSLTPKPALLNRPVSMFCLCGGLFIQEEKACSSVSCPHAMFSPTLPLSAASARFDMDE